MSVIHHQRPQSFDAVSWLARKYRVSRPYARLIAEMNGFGQRATIDFTGGTAVASHKREALAFRGPMR